VTGVVRFGLGDPEGWRSSSWRVWASPKGDVYVLKRATGRTLKVSLHASGQSHYAFNTDEIALAAGMRPGGGRFIMGWDAEEGRLVDLPLRQAFAVLLGGFSLGLPPSGSPVDAECVRDDVEWVEDLPPPGPYGWQFTVLLSDPGIPTTPPGRQAMGAVPVGGFPLMDGSNLWVMRHLVRLSEQGWENLHEAARVAVRELGRPTGPTVYRSDLFGSESDGLRWVAEVAVTAEPAAPAPQLAPGAVISLVD